MSDSRNFIGLGDASGGNPHKRVPPFAKGTVQRTELLLPGALLVAIQPKFLPAFVFVDFRLTTFFE